MQILYDVTTRVLDRRCQFTGVTATYENPYDRLLGPLLGQLNLDWPGAMLVVRHGGGIFRVKQAEGEENRWSEATVTYIREVQNMAETYPSQVDRETEEPVIELTARYRWSGATELKFCYIEPPADSVMRLLWRELLDCGARDLVTKHSGMPLQGFVRMLFGLDRVTYADRMGPTDLLRGAHSSDILDIAKCAFDHERLFMGYSGLARMFERAAQDGVVGSK